MNADDWQFEKWTIRFGKLESWVAENPEGVHEMVVAELINSARADFDNVERYWNAILVVGRALEDWPLCRCQMDIVEEEE